MVFMIKIPSRGGSAAPPDTATAAAAGASTSAGADASALNASSATGENRSTDTTRVAPTTAPSSSAHAPVTGPGDAESGPPPSSEQRPLHPTGADDIASRAPVPAPAPASAAVPYGSITGATPSGNRAEADLQTAHALLALMGDDAGPSATAVQQRGEEPRQHQAEPLGAPALPRIHFEEPLARASAESAQALDAPAAAVAAAAPPLAPAAPAPAPALSAASGSTPTQASFPPVPHATTAAAAATVPAASLDVLFAPPVMHHRYVRGNEIASIVERPERIRPCCSASAPSWRVCPRLPPPRRRGARTWLRSWANRASSSSSKRGRTRARESGF